jgi:hypothetical protein
MIETNAAKKNAKSLFSLLPAKCLDRGLHEHGERARTSECVSHSVLDRRTSLQPRLPCRCLTPPHTTRSIRRRSRRINESVARNGTRLAVRARCRNQFNTANLATTRRVRSQERAPARVRLGADFACGGRELRRRGRDRGAALGICRGADDGGALLGCRDSLAGRVGANNGYGDGGGDLTKDGSCLDDG